MVVSFERSCQGLNKRYGTEIIVSDATKLRLDPEYFVTRPLDVVAVKGKTRAVRVHELVGFRKLIAAERLSAYSIYDRAFEEYVRGNFQAAAEGFNVCAKAFGDKDTVTLMHRDRCLRLAANPPTEDWNCTVHIEDK